MVGAHSRYVLYVFHLGLSVIHLAGCDEMKPPAGQCELAEAALPHTTVFHGFEMAFGPSAQVPCIPQLQLAFTRPGVVECCLVF